MNIAIIKNNIPCPSANVVNTLRHADSFFKLGHIVNVMGVASPQRDSFLGFFLKGG